MNEIHIHDAIGELSEELIVPVEILRARKRHPVFRWVAAAACLCLLLSLPLGLGDRLAVKVENTNDGMKLEAPQENYLTDSVDNSSAYVSVLRARVLEVHEGWILVEPLKGVHGKYSSERYEVILSKIKQLPQMREGDIVEIAYDGTAQEVYPPRITEVFFIKVTE